MCRYRNCKLLSAPLAAQHSTHHEGINLSAHLAAHHSTRHEGINLSAAATARGLIQARWNGARVQLVQLVGCEDGGGRSDELSDGVALEDNFAQIWRAHGPVVQLDVRELHR